MGKKANKDQTTNRRSFLKLAGASAPAAIAAMTVSPTKAQAEVNDQAKSGVQDTAHTRAYFDSARF